MPQPQADPYQSAVQDAKQRYPRISNIPFTLTTGSGPGMSETYEPDDPANPHKGNWTVQLRHPSVVGNRSTWSDYIALESLHPLYANDKGYQQLTKQFVQSMTPEQMKAAKAAYEHDKKVFGDTSESFEKWLPRVQAQEYIRGMIFPKASPGWLGPKGEGGYTSKQLKLGQQIDQYLRSSR